MAKKSRQEKSNSEEKKEPFFVKIGVAEIIVGLTLLSAGFGIGYWVSSNEQRFTIMQQQFDCNEKIQQQKEVWESERKKEETLENIKLMLINSNIIGREDKDENTVK